MKIVLGAGKLLGAAERALSSTGSALSGVALVISMLLVVMGVIARYVLHVAAYFADEYAGYMLVLLTFLGLAYTLRTEGHIYVDSVIRLLPRKIRAWLEVVNCALALAATVLLITQTGEVAADTYRRGTVAATVLATPVFPLQALMPLGLSLLAVSLMTRIYIKIKTVVQGQS